MFSKGQGATEYLVLLAVVLMIALVSIALLGFFPGLAGDAKATQSNSYWKSARPFGVLEHRQVGSNITVVIQNNDPDQRSITQLNINGATNNTTATLNAGEKKSIDVSWVVLTAANCIAGSAYEYEVNITYSTVDLTGLKQLGTKRLVGKCAT